MTELHEKLERLKLLAETYLNEDKRVFLKDINDFFYFCDIILVGDKYITFQPFKGNFAGVKLTKLWAEIISVEEYVKREEDLE